jgi:conjugal transfer protein
MINEEISNRVVNIEVNVLKATYQEILSQVKKLQQRSKQHGGLDKLIKAERNEVKLKDMVKKGQLEEINVKDGELKELKKELNKHGVKFSVMQDKAKFFKQNIPYLAFFYVGNIFSHHVRAYTGGDVIDKIFQGILELNTMSFIPSIHPTDILMGVGVAALIKFVVYTKGKNAKKFRQGKEYGSARWGTTKDI